MENYLSEPRPEFTRARGVAVTLARAELASVVRGEKAGRGGTRQRAEMARVRGDN